MTSLLVDIPKLDSNAAPALTLQIGDAANPARFLATSTIGQAGGTGPVTVPPGARGYQYTADTDILLTVVAGAATAAPGNAVVFLEGFIDG